MNAETPRERSSMQRDGAHSGATTAGAHHADDPQARKADIKRIGVPQNNNTQPETKTPKRARTCERLFADHLAERLEAPLHLLKLRVTINSTA